MINVYATTENNYNYNFVVLKTGTLVFLEILVVTRHAKIETGPDKLGRLVTLRKKTQMETANKTRCRLNTSM